MPRSGVMSKLLIRISISPAPAGTSAQAKYNDASKEARVRLGENIHAAMVASEQQMKLLSPGLLLDL